jgi:hypothetical protein
VTHLRADNEFFQFSFISLTETDGTGNAITA